MPQLKDIDKRLLPLIRTYRYENGVPCRLISEELILKINDLLTKLSTQPDLICPTYRDSIQIEYSTLSGIDIEFEFFEDGKIVYTHDNGIISLDKNISIGELLAIVEYYF